MYVPDNYDAYCRYEAEQARRERLRKRKQIEHKMEEYENERIKDCCKPKAGHNND